MKKRLLLLMVLLLCLWGCSSNRPPEGDSIDCEQPPIPLDIFSFSHSGSSMEEIYTYTFTRGQTGVSVEVSLYAGREEYDLVVDDAVMEKLEALAGRYCVDKWDGFNESDSRVLDGYGFSLWAVCSDGTEIIASGSNAYPEGYGEFKNELMDILNEVNAP